MDAPPTSPPALQRRHLLQSLASVVAAVGLGLLSVWGIQAVGGPNTVQTALGTLAPLLIVPLHALVTLSPVGEFVPWGIVNGMVFGVGLGTVMNWIAWMLAALAQYVFGHRLGRGVAGQALRSRFPAWLDRLPLDHPLLLICGRWIPAGATFVNIAAGAGRVSLRRLLVCAALGTAPQAFLMALIGAGAGNWVIG